MTLTERSLADPRRRQLVTTMGLFAASLIAGYGVYEGKLKILAILGLVTLGVFLRQASYANAYLLTLLCANLAVVRFDVIADEFDVDKWIALGAMGALSFAVVAFAIRNPAWPRAIHAPVIALMGLSAWSTTWSSMPSLSFAKAGVFSIALVVAFLGIWTWARDLDGVRRILDVHVDAMWMVWPLSVAVLVVGVGGDSAGGRFRSIFTNPNNLGFWASLTAPLLLGLAVSHPQRWRRVACWAMLPCAALCTVLAGSRGGMVGMLLGCGLYCLARYPRRTLLLAVVGALTVVFLFAYGFELVLPQSLHEIIRPDTIDDLSERRAWWQLGLLVWQQQPYFGHGFGLTDLLFAQYGLDTAMPGTFSATVHNSYLEAAMNIGTVGLALVVLIQVWTGLTGLRTWWRDRDGQTGLMALTLTCVVVAVSAHAAIESVLFAAGSPWCLPYWVSVGLIHRLATIPPAPREGS